MTKQSILNLPDTEEIVCTAKELKDLIREVEEERVSRIEIELDRAFPKDQIIPKRSVLFLMANGTAQQLTHHKETDARE